MPVAPEKEYLTYDPVYNNHIRALGQIGVGLEYRLTCHIGLMGAFTWNFVFGPENHEDKIGTAIEQGEITVISPVVQPTTMSTTTTVINTAHYLKPGHGS